MSATGPIEPEKVYVRIIALNHDLELMGLKLGDVVMAERFGYSYWLCGEGGTNWQRYISGWSVKELDNCEVIVHLGKKEKSCKKRINRSR